MTFTTDIEAYEALSKVKATQSNRIVTNVRNALSIARASLRRCFTASSQAAGLDGV